LLKMYAQRHEKVR